MSGRNKGSQVDDARERLPICGNIARRLRDSISCTSEHIIATKLTRQLCPTVLPQLCLMISDIYEVCVATAYIQTWLCDA